MLPELDQKPLVTKLKTSAQHGGPLTSLKFPFENEGALLAPAPPKYAELVAECARWGIRRTKAFELARVGLIDTFAIGRKRYVYIDSLLSLPTRLQKGEVK